MNEAALAVALTCVVLTTIVAYLLRRREFKRSDPALAQPLPPHTCVSGVERFLSERDAAVGPLRPGTGSSVRWAGRPDEQAKLCVIFLHGWSASPDEIDPVDADVASSVGANLLRFRLTGHGLQPFERSGAAMRDHATAAALRADAATAFALGRLLGQRVVVVGCSTGGSLALWLASQPWSHECLAAIVLISPAWQVAKFGTALYNALKWPLILAPRFLAHALLRAFAGATIAHKVDFAREPEHCRVWTHRYPSACVLNIIEVYVGVEVGVDCPNLQVPVLAFANPKDQTINFAATEAYVRSMPAATLEVITDSESAHVLTGRLKSPSTVPRCTSRIKSFIKFIMKKF